MKNHFVFFLFVVTSLLSCNKQNYRASRNVPDVGLPLEKIDKQLIAYAPTGWNNFSIGEPISIEVVANQNVMVSFKPNNVKIYYWDEEEWKEAVNKITQYPFDFTVILDPVKKNDPIFRGSATILPDLGLLSKSVDLKIFVFGKIYKNGIETNEEVGAFVDVRLKP